MNTRLVSDPAGAAATIAPRAPARSPSSDSPVAHGMPSSAAAPVSVPPAGRPLSAPASIV